MVLWYHRHHIPSHRDADRLHTEWRLAHTPLTYYTIASRCQHLCMPLHNFLITSHHTIFPLALKCLSSYPVGIRPNPRLVMKLCHNSVSRHGHSVWLCYDASMSVSWSWCNVTDLDDIVTVVGDSRFVSVLLLILVTSRWWVTYFLLTLSQWHRLTVLSFTPLFLLSCAPYWHNRFLLINNFEITSAWACTHPLCGVLFLLTSKAQSKGWRWLMKICI